MRGRRAAISDFLPSSLLLFRREVLQQLGHCFVQLFHVFSFVSARIQREAVATGLDPNVWINNVEVIAAARVGAETVNYVSNIYKYYVAYKLIALQEEQRRKAKESLQQKPS